MPNISPTQHKEKQILYVVPILITSSYTIGLNDIYYIH